jgi:23S rRNA pseudouridine2457 synthase
MRPRTPRAAARLILFNKPYGVLSQFTDDQGRPVLADYLRLPGIRPVGRLDRDSEGLLLLTDHGGLLHRLADPRHKVWKTYWAQVEGVPDPTALERLRQGLLLNDGPTLPAQASLLDPPELWPRQPPIRYRAAIPTHWIELRIREGRNRQVRRMTAAVGLPTLRLVRVAVGHWELGGLPPGAWQEIPSTG